MDSLTKREDEIISDLAVAMKFKFRLHKNKGSWERKDHSQLLKELQREITELIKAPDKESIVLEAADCANYLAMIIDLAHRRGIK